MRSARLVLALAGLACQSAPGETSPFVTSLPPPPDAGTSTSGDGPDSSSTAGVELSTGSGSGGASSGAALDVGTADDFGADKPPGCAGKIDLLFVISRAAGMEYFQTQLLDAFPKFITTIEAAFADFDYHIMVVDGDDDWGLITCDEECPAQCVPDYPCGYMPTVCDKTMGAGVVFAAGDDATNEPCFIEGGRRYMYQGQNDLTETFSCVARVGSSGRDYMGEALTAAVKSGINGPGGCNAGFLRDDALLMVTLISNTYDHPVKPWGSYGTPETWAEALLAAKHGDAESIVLFSILEASASECHTNDRVCQLVKMFPYGLLADISDADYGPAFAQATGLVAEACAGFAPPG